MSNKSLLAAAVIAASVALPTQAAITVADGDAGTVSIDGFFNTHYVNSSTDNNIGNYSRDTSRIKMGFLPNYVGINFATEVDGLKVGGRSSFWVSINDTDSGLTSTGIDVRQFYATIDGDFGQILVGKDFSLFNRSNIFLDQMLTGYGAVNDTLGLIDGQGVSFGNIGSGYTYPFPKAQITYRTPDMGGFKAAIGLIDPTNTSPDALAEETTPRIEAEVTYASGPFTGWVGFLNQSSESIDGSSPDVDSTGISYGAVVKMGGLTIHASGFDGEGLGLLLGPTDVALGLGGLQYDPATNDEVDSSGYLAQVGYAAGAVRFVASYGQTEVEADPSNNGTWEMETTQLGVFYSVNSKVTLSGEFNTNEISIAGATEETDTIAMGVTVAF